MKIGIFDSGLGGLFIMRHIVKKLPAYDYVYLGDTKRVPYGNRSHETILEFTKEALEFLFSQNCSLVILACNSASAHALRQIQKYWLPKNYPDKKVLGVIIPTVEEALQYAGKRIGVLATTSTVQSNTFVREIRKRNKSTIVKQQPAPLLVPLVEAGEMNKGKDILRSYLRPLARVDTLILGCTHYGILINKITPLLPKHTRILSQNTIIPKKLAEYLQRHAKIESQLSKKKRRIFYVTEMTPTIKKTAQNWFGKSMRLQKAQYAD